MANLTINQLPTKRVLGTDEIELQAADNGISGKTTVKDLRGFVSVKDYGAIGDGVTDDTSNIQAAINATSDFGTLTLSKGETYLVSTLNVTGKAIVIEGNGGKLVSNGSNGAIYKTDHGNKLTVRNVRFSGAGAGIYQNAASSTTVYSELLIEECSFDMNSGVYGIKLVGGREPIITKCLFQNTNSGNGIYLKETVSPFVNLCIFKGSDYVGNAVYYPGTGSAYDAGLVLRDCEIMGWENGLQVIGCDWLAINGCTIDYNTNSIILKGQDGANISNNYIGSVGANPALTLASDAGLTAPTYCAKIVVQNNTFTGHYTGGSTYDCILVAGTSDPDEIQINNNNIHFYTRYGISFDMGGQRLTIKENSFGARATFGVAPIYNTAGDGDTAVIIKDNYFTTATTITAMNLSANCVNVNGNIGCVTNVASQVVVANGTDTATFAHGLTGYTPTVLDVFLSPANAAAATARPYVQSIDGTNCTINTVSVASGNAGVLYRISRYKA